MDRFPSFHRQHNLRIPDLVDSDGRRVTIKDHQVSKQARLQVALLVLL
jgi:hypothetical protein